MMTMARDGRRDSIPPPRHEQIARFTESIYEPGDLIEVRAIPSGNGRPTRRWMRAVDLPDQADSLGDLNDRGAHVFFGINPRLSRKGGTARHVLHARALFVDFDDVAVEEALRRIDEATLPAPTVSISSGHGVHAYWRVDDPVTDLGAWTRCQKALARKLHSDPAVSDPPRLARLPGFKNWSPPPAHASLIRVEPAAVYSIEEFGHLYEAHERTLKTFEGVASLPSHVHAAVQAAIERSLPTGPGQRHRRVFALARWLRGIPALGDRDAVELLPVVRDWHQRCVHLVRTKDLASTEADFIRAWPRVDHPLGHQSDAYLDSIVAAARQRPVPPEVANIASDAAHEIAKLCVELQARAGEGDFLVAQVAIGKAIGLPQPVMSVWLGKLCDIGFLRRTREPGPGRAARYRCTSGGEESRS